MKTNAETLAWTLLGFLAAGSACAEVTVVCPADAAPLVRLAAKEVARYLYVRTGTLLTVGVQAKGAETVALSLDPALGPSHYALRSDGAAQRIVGGDPLGALYGAYRYAEKLGVRFYLHGDVMPDARLAELPRADETGAPLFSVRGIQPFHDFPEGPDGWNRDDYFAVLSQLAKLRMNFIGLHCYPEGGVGPEPLVWIGPTSDLDREGHVTFSYPAQWAHTGRDRMWGYAAMKTGDFCAGASLAFEADDFGPDVQDFNGVGDLLRAVFAEAKRLGIQTCVGTETPLTIPKAVQERLKAQGKNPGDPAVVSEVYEGLFKRIATLCPVDYYWLWTPEDWTWSGNKADQFADTARDIRSALAALERLGKPFELATCGWVLGPQHNRAALDELLPKSSPMGCINREVGHAADEPFFANLTGRPKWVIPWMENDPSLVAPQPWVGRMRWDAADALRLGCTGLLGIHWRTKQMAPNVSALASAAWEQPWRPEGYPRTPFEPVKRTFGAQGGSVAAFTEPVANTDTPAVYQTVRYGLSGYVLEVPSGRYTVTLKFNEPHYREAGKRVFGASVQGKKVIDKLDVFAKVGANRALDFAFNDIEVSDGKLRIDFESVVEFPCIAGIEVSGTAAGVNQLPGQAYARRINCGGPSLAGFEADGVADAAPVAPKGRAMPVKDFYLDFSRAHFGDEVAPAAADIFARIDGVNLPEPATWLDGPGGIRVETRPWSDVKPAYAFVDELAALRPRIKGDGNASRFDYWLNTYRCMAAMAELGCLRGELDALVGKLKAEPLAAQQAISVRLRLARLWEAMMTFQLAATDTPGELGTVANLEQHNRVFLKFIGRHEDALVQALGRALPPEAEVSGRYAGAPRVAVPTVRTHVAAGEALRLKIIALDAAPPRAVLCFTRRLGTATFAPTEAHRLGRGVYAVGLPPADDDFEYYVRVETASGASLVWPATAPALNQTVVVWK